MKRLLTPLAIILLLAIAPTVTMWARSTKGSSKKIPIEALDMDAIKRDVLNPDSKYYYPRLMKEYEKNETIMDLQAYRHLYFGAVFQEDYNPYRHSPLDDKIDELYYKEKHSRAELDSIMAYAEEALRDDPFDLSQINFMIYAMQKRGKANKAKIWKYRLDHLIEAILSTGTGADMDNAWVVIDPKHEFNIINFQGAVAESAAFEGPYYEYIRLKPDAKAKPSDKRPEGFWFNIRYILEEYNRKFPEEQ